MASAIDQLEQALWSRCVRERMPEDDATIARWMSDEEAHLTERYKVTLMDEDLRPLLREAILEWNQRESMFLSRAGGHEFSFLAEFEQLRDLYMAGKLKPKNQFGPTFELGNAAHGIVKNMDWVNLFSWILPQADPENLDDHRQRGKAVTAVFYTELLHKYAMYGRQNIVEALTRVEARWQILHKL